MRFIRHKALFFAVCLLCLLFPLWSPTLANQELSGGACQHIFAQKEDQSFRIEASISIVQPLDHAACVAIRFSYLQPVNYEVICFRLYHTESEWIEIPFAPGLQEQTKAPSVFAALIPVYDGFPDGRLVPIISDGRETEEMVSAEIVLGEDK